MRILIVNDDGIHASGLYHLTKAAQMFGEVMVVAPANQCSAMSHRIIIDRPLLVTKENILDGVTAYSVDGTPADCVKVAAEFLMTQKPDLVLSGINNGYNLGLDILYSGTVAACMEALLYDIPAIAFSTEVGGGYDAFHHYFPILMKALQHQTIAKNEIWNINIPGCEASNVRGILYDRIPSNAKMYRKTNYIREEINTDQFTLKPNYIKSKISEENTDLAAVTSGYISVGKIKNMILAE